MSEDTKAPLTSGFKDAEDVKMDHFTYTQDEGQLDIWENTPSLSPLDVPVDIKTKYPGMRFHWVSEGKLKRVGVGYQGWKLFTDSKYPEGVRRGNDLRLAAMPEERAARYNQYVAQQSTDRVAALADKQAEDAFRASDIAAIKGMGAGVEITGTGISGLKERAQAARMDSKQRAEFNKEVAAKADEARRKARKIFSFGRG